MKIGQLARTAGLNASAIRYYEKRGLLAPPQRLGGQRRYAGDALSRILLIRFATDMGFTLAEIKLFLSGLRDNAPVGPRWKKLATRKLREVDQSIVRSRKLKSRIVAQPFNRVRLASPFLLRTAQPPVASVEGRVVRELRRIGKRIAIGVEGDLWMVLHLMIAGRLHWRLAGAKLVGRQSLAAFDFPNGSLVLTEAGTKHRASLHVLAGEEGLRSIDPGGIDIFSSDLSSFRAALTFENRTLKRALTDPRLVSGIGNAYSDEILHAAQLSPITLARKLE